MTEKRARTSANVRRRPDDERTEQRSMLYTTKPRVLNICFLDQPSKQYSLFEGKEGSPNEILRAKLEAFDKTLYPKTTRVLQVQVLSPQVVYDRQEGEDPLLALRRSIETWFSTEEAFVQATPTNARSGGTKHSEKLSLVDVTGKEAKFTEKNDSERWDMRIHIFFLFKSVPWRYLEEKTDFTARFKATVMREIRAAVEQQRQSMDTWCYKPLIEHQRRLLDKYIPIAGKPDDKKVEMIYFGIGNLSGAMATASVRIPAVRLAEKKVGDIEQLQQDLKDAAEGKMADIRPLAALLSQHWAHLDTVHEMEVEMVRTYEICLRGGRIAAFDDLSTAARLFLNNDHIPQFLAWYIDRVRKKGDRVITLNDSSKKQEQYLEMLHWHHPAVTAARVDSLRAAANEWSEAGRRMAGDRPLMNKLASFDATAGRPRLLLRSKRHT